METKHKRRVRYILSLMSPIVRDTLKRAKLEPLCTLEAEEMFMQWVRKNGTRLGPCDCVDKEHIH